MPIPISDATRPKICPNPSPQDAKKLTMTKSLTISFATPQDTKDKTAEILPKSSATGCKKIQWSLDAAFADNELQEQFLENIWPVLPSCSSGASSLLVSFLLYQTPKPSGRNLTNLERKKTPEICKRKSKTNLKKYFRQKYENILFSLKSICFLQCWDSQKYRQIHWRNTVDHNWEMQ